MDGYQIRPTRLLYNYDSRVRWPIGQIFGGNNPRKDSKDNELQGLGHIGLNATERTNIPTTIITTSADFNQYENQCERSQTGQIWTIDNMFGKARNWPI